ncbi:MAG: mandelate racemase/muconate lactonizing enzyme family protein [Chloroflexi bacterium]|nr:mandelate racemase/muconate lactonizing enzyme family protein [Chloroflexota bacterium]
MKITKIEGVLARFPLPKEMRAVWAPGQVSRSIGLTVVKIHTDEGITGIGASHVVGDVQVLASIRSLAAPFFLGKDPFQMDEHIRTLYSASFFGSRLWLVDQALWDIVGKAAGQPIYRLWGAAQERIPAYAAPNEPRSPRETAELALRLREEGFKAIKLSLHDQQMKDDIALVQAVRDEVGDTMAIMTDANQALLANAPEPHPRWDYRRALATARALDALDVYYLEEPLYIYIYDFDAIARLTAETDILIAGGEWNVGTHEFRWLLEKGAYDILQPDATQSDGLFQMHKVAAMAQARGKKFIPHTWGNGIGLAANLQVALSAANCPFFEYPYDPVSLPVEVNQWMLQEPLRVDKEGYINAPTGPGLGITLNDELIEKYTTHRM